MEKQEDEDEEKVIQIYLRVKQRMECLRKKREQEVIKNYLLCWFFSYCYYNIILLYRLGKLSMNIKKEYVLS